MMKYGDDQCEECGGIRVAKSFLCADCLAKACARLSRQIAKADLKIVALEAETAFYHGELAGALNYGFKQNQENVRLNRIINELMDDVYGPEIKEG